MSGAGISAREFGRMPDGRVVHEYTLDNGAGMTLSAIEFGAIVTRLAVPDRDGRSANVVLGFSGLDDYLERNPNFGTVVGRYANRIAGARFVLDGVEHRLDANDGTNCLHGGARGFGKRCWSGCVPAPQADGALRLAFELVSEDGEGGFPGRLEARVTYTLAAGRNEWRVDYRARTDRATVVNLSHHDYFNLAGAGSALEQRLTLAAGRYLAIDRTLVPVAIEAVDGTPFDFRRPTRIGERIRSAHAQLALARGYDHNFVLDRGGAGLAFAARLEDAASGRVLELETTEPGLQLYSGNFLAGSLLGSGGHLYRQGDGICLEPQHFPDSPNRSDFPSTVLRPGETFESATLYRFGVA